MALGEYDFDCSGTVWSGFEVDFHDRPAVFAVAFDVVDGFASLPGGSRPQLHVERDDRHVFRVFLV